jgi:hypothetical protein
VRPHELRIVERHAHRLPESVVHRWHAYLINEDPAHDLRGQTEELPAVVPRSGRELSDRIDCSHGSGENRQSHHFVAINRIALRSRRTCFHTIDYETSALPGFSCPQPARPLPLATWALAYEA